MNSSFDYSIFHACLGSGRECFTLFLSLHESFSRAESEPLCRGALRKGEREGLKMEGVGFARDRGGHSFRSCLKTAAFIHVSLGKCRFICAETRLGVGEAGDASPSLWSDTALTKWQECGSVGALQMVQTLLLKVHFISLVSDVYTYFHLDQHHE